MIRSGSTATADQISQKHLAGIAVDRPWMAFKYHLINFCLLRRRSLSSSILCFGAFILLCSRLLPEAPLHLRCVFLLIRASLRCPGSICFHALFSRFLVCGFSYTFSFGFAIVLAQWCRRDFVFVIDSICPFSAREKNLVFRTGADPMSYQSRYPTGYCLIAPARAQS